MKSSEIEALESAGEFELQSGRLRYEAYAVGYSVNRYPQVPARRPAHDFQPFWRR